MALAALLGAFLLAAPAHAAEKVVTITAEGVSPKVLEVAAGDTITFVNEDTTFGYRARATSDNWDLDSGPVGLLPGRSYTHPDPITEAGTYTYRVAEGEPYEGSVLLRGANTVSPRPTKPASTAPKPRPSSAAAPRPTPSPTGGSGTAQAPPVGGGFGSLGAPSAPPAEGVAPPPAIALPELPGESAGPLPEAAPEPRRGGRRAAGRAGPPGRTCRLPRLRPARRAGGRAGRRRRVAARAPAARRAGRPPPQPLGPDRSRTGRRLGLGVDGRSCRTPGLASAADGDPGRCAGSLSRFADANALLPRIVRGR